MLARRRDPAFSAAGSARLWRGRWMLVAVLITASLGALAAGGAGKDRAILAAVQRLMLFYSGAFALIALTAAVVAGLVATDRIFMPPAGRVMSQAVHRALSLAAVGFLATHVVMEVLAHRSRPVDAVGPFLANGQRLYLGLGTLASDLVLLVLVTGVARRRFAGWPAAWRAVHVTAYLAWPMAILHGLLAGRQAKPYVYWSYGGCLAAVALALAIRLVATVRSRTEVAAHPVPEAGTPSIRPGARAAIPAALEPTALWSGPPTSRPVPLPPPRAVWPGDPQRGDAQRGGVQRGGIQRAASAPGARRRGTRRATWSTGVRHGGSQHDAER